MQISFWTIFTKFLKNISLIFYFKKKLPKNLNKRRIEVDGRIWMKMDCNVRNWRAAVFLVCLRWRLLRVKWVAMATVNGQVGTRVSAATCTRGAHIHLHLINIWKVSFLVLVQLWRLAGWWRHRSIATCSPCVSIYLLAAKTLTIDGADRCRARSGPIHTGPWRQVSVWGRLRHRDSL